MSLFRAIAKAFGGIKIVKGTIIQVGDSHFNSFTVQQPIKEAKGELPIGVTRPASDTYTIRVKGVDKKGNEITEDITVDEMTFNTVNVGDPWPVQ